MRGCLLIGLSLFSFAALGAEPAALPPEFAMCSRIQNSGERLACYDRAVEYLQRSGDGVAAPSAEGSFGLQTRPAEPRAKEKTTDPTDEELRSVTAKVAEVSASRNGLKIVTLDNGQVWRQIDGSPLASVKVGEQITVSRGALGSFRMSLPNGPPLRVRRVK